MSDLRRFADRWTLAELRSLIPKLEAELREIEGEQPFDVKPVGPLTRDEAHELLLALLGQAERGALTREQSFVGGQLLRVFENAVIARTLGRPGRYMVVSEEQIDELMRELNHGGPT